MKKRYYFNPSMVLSLSVPDIPSKLHYTSIKKFVECIEEMEPNVIADLLSISELYTDLVDDFFSPFINEGSSNVWDLLSSANNNDCLIFKQSLLEWARKWNLVDPATRQSLYIEMAIRAIIRHVHHEDGISLVDRISEKSIGSDTFNTIYPFSFSPSRFSLITDDPADIYEELWQRERARVSSKSLLKQGYNPREIENAREYAYPWNGIAWNPLEESWKEFEKKMDDAFKKYKEAYKQRTENAMESWGFINEEEKRKPEHFKWFVRYQLNPRLSMPDIADEFSKEDDIITEDGVSKALHSIEKLVLLPLRPSSTGGRNRK